MVATNTVKKTNYSADDVTKLHTLYAEFGNDGMDKIAHELGKAVRSVRAKLVRDGIYVAPVKGVTVKKEGPSKKEMLTTLERLAPFPVDGLVSATKESLAHLIFAFSPKSDS